MNSFAITAKIPHFKGDTEDTIADRVNEATKKILDDIGLSAEEISVHIEIFHQKGCPSFQSKSMHNCNCPHLDAMIEPIATPEEQAFYLQKVKDGKAKYRTHEDGLSEADN